MARKYQREAAARARAGRAAARATAASNSPPVFDNLAGWDSETPGADHTAPIFVDSGSESDCYESLRIRDSFSYSYYRAMSIKMR
jgi:hypothetical protein